jgi:hypothetical protein
MISRAPRDAVPAGYVFSHQTNDSFIALNRLVNGNEDVYWTKAEFSANGKTYPAGTNFVSNKSSTLAKLERLAAETGVGFDAVFTAPPLDASPLRPVRIGLWDQYGGSVASGWTRLVLETFEFPFTLVYPNMLDEGDLAKSYDALIFVDDGIRELNCAVSGDEYRYPQEIPAEYRGQLGAVTVERTFPQIRKFLEDGGRVLAMGCSSRMGEHMGLPIRNALLERLPNGFEQPLPSTKFYIPGSVLEAKVDNTTPLGFGLAETVHVFYDNSPSFRLLAEAEKSGVKAVVRFGADPLRSGWALGESHLENSAAVIEAGVGKGRLFLYGPQITFRAQPHGIFKLLFNGVYYGRGAAAPLYERAGSNQ